MTLDRPDLLGRVLVERHFSVEKQLVKYNAFLLALWNDVWTTSVFDIDGLADVDIWALGNLRVAVPRGKPLYGHAEVQRLSVEDQKLNVTRSEPPERHCNIIGWPNSK